VNVRRGWSSDTARRTAPKFSDTTNGKYLYVGEAMQLDERLTSANGQYFAVHKDDGDFYLCQQDGTPYQTIANGFGNLVETWRAYLPYMGQ